jgi:hypothetical protein
MFDSKRETLFTKDDVKNNKTSVKNGFLNQGMKESSMTTEFGNGAVKYTTTNDDFVDQFGLISNYRNPREFSEISKDMSILWGVNPKDAIKLAFYIRMISRKTQIFDGTTTEKVQIGQGLKHEGIMRMIWLAVNHPDEFWNNAYLYVAISSWKDIIQMLSYDLQYNGWDERKLDWNKMGKLILSGLENPNTTNLVRKYLPTIKSNSKCKTLEAQADNIIGKWFANILFKGENDSYAKYRKVKSSGTAHEWQKLISQGKMLDINFDTVHGRALSLMVSSKFINNNGLGAKFDEWLDKQPIMKFTGYVYELFKPLMNNFNVDLRNKKVINKQFKMLVDQVKEQTDVNSSFIAVLDTSASMGGSVSGLNISAMHVAKSIGIYFSELLEGTFKNHWIEFHSEAKMRQWKGETPVDKYINDNSSYVGSTNFLDVARVFIDIKNKGVSEDEFPTGIVCISDGNFNQANDYGYMSRKNGSHETNTKHFKEMLLSAGFTQEFVDNFKIVLWDIPNNFYGGEIESKFEDFADAPNLYYMSGFDPSALSFLLGSVDQKDKPTPKNARELFEAAMDQEILNFINI